MSMDSGLDTSIKEEGLTPYFKLSTNEYGKHWLFYKPLNSEPGRYGCWMPIDDEFYKEFQSKDREIAELKAEREKLAYRITELLNESIDLGMEIRKLKADILNFKEWYREANAATRAQVLEKLNKIA
jgi:hypothetical protein